MEWVGGGGDRKAADRVMVDRRRGRWSFMVVCFANMAVDFFNEQCCYLRIVSKRSLLAIPMLLFV